MEFISMLNECNWSLLNTLYMSRFKYMMYDVIPNIFSRAKIILQLILVIENNVF